MGKISWKIMAAVGFIVFSQTTSAAPNSPVAMVADDSAYQDSAYQDVPQPDDPRSIGLLAQPEAPAAPVTTAPPDSKGPQDPSPPAIASSPNPTSKAVVMKAGPTVVGCGLKYLSAELAGKLKG